MSSLVWAEYNRFGTLKEKLLTRTVLELESPALRCWQTLSSEAGDFLLIESSHGGQQGRWQLYPVKKQDESNLHFTASRMCQSFPL